MSCQLDEIEVGEEYNGSLVTMIEQDVEDGPEKYHIKRKINLADGTQMFDEYWKEKKPGSKKYESKVDRLDDCKLDGSSSNSHNDNQKSKLRNPNNKKSKYKNSTISKDKRRSDAREKAREMMASRHSKHGDGGKSKRKSTDSICSASSSGTISNESTHSYIDDFY